MNYFRNPDFLSARGTVVGEINGLSVEERWEVETNLFAAAISKYIPQTPCQILDYGCGIGRMSKKLLEIRPACSIVGVDNSEVQLAHARSYTNSPRFTAVLPHEVAGEFDFAFSLYVFQHVQAIYLRQTLQIIHHHLVPAGTFINCCSERRMSIRNDAPRFFDDRFLGTDVFGEIELLFEPFGDLFTPREINEEPLLRKIILGETGSEEPDSAEVLGDSHPARVYRRRELAHPYCLLPMS